MTVVIKCCKIQVKIQASSTCVVKFNRERDGNYAETEDAHIRIAGGLGAPPRMGSRSTLTIGDNECVCDAIMNAAPCSITTVSIRTRTLPLMGGAIISSSPRLL